MAVDRHGPQILRRHLNRWEKIARARQELQPSPWSRSTKEVPGVAHLNRRTAVETSKIDEPAPTWPRPWAVSATDELNPKTMPTDTPKLLTPSRTQIETDGHCMPRPHGNCYWLVPGLVLAGEYPRVLEDVPARQRLRNTLNAGVRHFVDLTESSEPLARYDEMASEEAASLGLAVSYERHPIRDLGVPDVTRMRSILNALRSPRGGAAYVHCWGGIGRTGTVVGCLLVEWGFSGEEALALIARKWQSMDKRLRQPHSPETPQQRDFILDWRPAG